MAPLPEDVIRNAIFLHRLANGAAAETRAGIVSLFDRILAALLKYDPTAVARRYQADRVDRFVLAINELSKSAYAVLYATTRAQLALMGREYGVRTVSQLRIALGAGKQGTVVTAPSQNMMKAIIDSRPLEGHLLKDWFKDQGQRTAFNVERQVKVGLTRGEALGDLVRRVRGRSAGGGRYVGGAMETTSRQAEAIVRTATSHICNEAALETYKQGGDVVSQVQFVATLDGRTSLECAAYDGQVFDLDDPSLPRPPLHVNCRSVLVGVIDYKALGLAAPPSSMRAAEGGPVSGKTDYTAWLRSQSAAKVDSILGPTRGRLFREGKMDLQDFVRSDGTAIRVSELREAA